ncbi:MAG TPA: lipid-A-disaccharide synthase [Verrucomicrobiota bacterium]|nr:lipid-A-disaccharide synthase [Verrucomicrobiota bacterium]HNT15248.1 lipid-A-disaccharide synthase [Verrucomicrobiota bacterium]
MRPPSFMLIAGDPSGDQLAAELVAALREAVVGRHRHASADVQPLHTALVPRFFGAGGPRMAAAGVELLCDLTRYSVIGIAEVWKNFGAFRRAFQQLKTAAAQREPDVIIGVDSSGFNLRFARAIHARVRRQHGWFQNWQPKLVQFVSPQVWASRPGRAFTLAEYCDLLLSIFPFEKAWYARRVPQLRVEFVGHPMIGRVPAADRSGGPRPGPGRIVLLPGSRPDEVRRHTPLVLRAFEILRGTVPALTGKLIVPTAPLAAQIQALPLPAGIEVQVGGLTDALTGAALALTKSGTITMECALHGVPAVVFYKTSWPTYCIGRRIVTVKYLAMPNLLADAPIYPELIQAAATPENLARAALELLQDEARRTRVQQQLAQVVASLGAPGAAQRAAAAVLNLL